MRFFFRLIIVFFCLLCLFSTSALYQNRAYQESGVFCIDQKGSLFPLRREEIGNYTSFKLGKITLNVIENQTLPNEVYLGFNFSADLAEIFIDGEKVNDMLYTGMPFEVSMRYYDFPREFTLRLQPLSKSADVYLERTPIYNERDIACSLDSITAEDIYTTEFDA